MNVLQLHILVIMNGDNLKKKSLRIRIIFLNKNNNDNYTVQGI